METVNMIEFIEVIQNDVREDWHEKSQNRFKILIWLKYGFIKKISSLRGITSLS